MPRVVQIFACLIAVLLLLNGSLSVLAQNPPQPSPAQQPQYRVHVTSELVLVNVVVRDKKGNLVRDLKKDDFTLLEDGKRQAISTFDFENVDELATAGADARRGVEVEQHADGVEPVDAVVADLAGAVVPVPVPLVMEAVFIERP